MEKIWLKSHTCYGFSFNVTMVCLSANDPICRLNSCYTCNRQQWSFIQYMILVILIVYGKLELKPVNSRRNKNSSLINTIINIWIVYIVIDIAEDIKGSNTTLVVTVLCIHCILNVNCLLTNIVAQMLDLKWIWHTYTIINCYMYYYYHGIKTTPYPLPPLHHIFICTVFQFICHYIHVYS